MVHIFLFSIGYLAEFIGRDEYLQELESGWQTIAPHLFIFNYSVSSDAEKSEVNKAIKKFYFNNKPVSRKTVPKLLEVMKMLKI